MHRRNCTPRTEQAQRHSRGVARTIFLQSRVLRRNSASIPELIVNAAQELAKGGTLSIRGKEEDDWLVLEFADTGHGIPPEIQSKIFDPFFTTKPVGQGTGLGLSLVYKIITERHHGVIQVASPNHQGATFTIRIPEQQEPDHE